MKKISLSESEVKDLLDLYQSEIDRAQRRINNLKSIIEKLSEGSPVESEIEKPSKNAKKGRKPKIQSKRKDIIEKQKITREPKKRGRKKKVVDIKVEPKKRGRKPKPKINEISAIAELPEIKKKAIDGEPKKRGRKPKAIAAEIKVVNDKKEVKTAKKAKKVKAAPKKRGRKPKSLRKPIKGGKGKDKVKWNDFILETITEKNSLMLASSLTQAAIEKFNIAQSDRDRVRMAISTTLTKMVNSDKVLQTYAQKGIRVAFFGLAAWFNEKAELQNDYKKKLI